MSDPGLKASHGMNEVICVGLVTESLSGLWCQSSLRRGCTILLLPVSISADAKSSSLRDWLLLVKMLFAERKTFVLMRQKESYF